MPMQPELFKKCVWKSVIQSDASKRKRGLTSFTFSRKNPQAERCYDCSGNDEKCERFAAEE